MDTIVVWRDWRSFCSLPSSQGRSRRNSNMSIDDKQEYVAAEAVAPRWVGIVVIALAIVSLAALGTGWSASNHSKELAQNLATTQQQEKQQDEVLSQRLAKAEDTNAQLQGELSIVTDKMKLTQGELTRARAQANKIKEEDARQLAYLQNNVNGELATKAGVDDVNKLGTDVNGVKTDLESTKNSLNMTRGEFGTLIAKNHDEVEELRRLGERDYYEFKIEKRDQPKKVANLINDPRGANPKKTRTTTASSTEDAR